VAVLLAGGALAGVTACDPADGLGATAVSATTDQLATRALRHDHVDVQWLSCSATQDKTRDTVDCLGRTKSQQKISVKGTVTKQMDGECVRGRLTATVGGRTVWDVGGLGECTPRTSASRTSAES
jgi:hypothetical protein